MANRLYLVAKPASAGSGQVYLYACSESASADFAAARHL